jgi:hypothetical protein
VILNGHEWVAGLAQKVGVSFNNFQATPVICEPATDSEPRVLAPIGADLSTGSVGTSAISQ